MFNKLFKSKEQKELIREILNIGNRHENRNGFSVVKDGAIRLVAEYKKKIKDEEFRAADLALGYVMTVAGEHLVMGTFHTYRGTLSLKGDHVYGLWGRCLAEQVTNGIRTKEDADILRKEMRESIAAVG